jgi:hypothetical protein
VVIMAIVILVRGTGYMDWVTTSGKVGGIGFWRFGPLVLVDQRRYEICVYLIDIPLNGPAMAMLFRSRAPWTLKHL